MKKFVAMTVAAIGAAALAVPGAAAAGGDFNSTLEFLGVEQPEGESVFTGRVLANRANCRSDRKVELQVKTKDEQWRTVDTDRSSEGGAFALLLDDSDLGPPVRGKMHQKKIAAGTCAGDVEIVPF